MSNLAKIYSEAVGRGISLGEVIEEQSPAEQATRKQLKFQWLSSTPTEELIKSLRDEEKGLIDSSIRLAESTITDPKHVINSLIRVSQIRRTLHTITQQ